MAKKWQGSTKEKYDNQNKIWVKVCKDPVNYTEEIKATDFKDVDCYEFLFKKFDMNQTFNLQVDNDSEELNNKIKVKKAIDVFFSNIIGWKNVLESDLIEGGEKVEIEFDVEPFDALLSENFWLVGALLSCITNEINRRKELLELQKKT